MTCASIKCMVVRRVLACAVNLACLLGSAASMAAVGIGLQGPIVQLIDVQERDDHADITVQFACSVRYVSNLPASRGAGTTITLRLGPDCGTQLGTLPPELPLVGGGGTLVTGARVDSLIAGQVTLEITFARVFDFVVAPSASGQGLKVRLLNPVNRKAKVLISEVEEPASYAVNLESAQSPFTHESVESAAATLQTQAYVSETDIENEHWYRLRVGPYSTRAEAERVLALALDRFPRAWLATEETPELVPLEHAGAATAPAQSVSDPPLPDAQRIQMLRDAHIALDQHRFAEAIDWLNRLLRQPEFPLRADAQELLGLARERAGQLAQAKAEYQEYLRRYPDGPAAARIRSRLQTLAAASLAPKSMADYAGAPESRWTLAGSGAISYQYGKDQTVSSGTTTTTNTLDSALIYGDLLMRNQGQRYDFTARADSGYTQNIASASGGSQDRTTAAYGELVDRQYGVTARAGRQSLASQGIIGIFDGIFVGYQVNSRWSVSGAAGLPAYSSYSPLSGRQKFGTVTAEFDPFHQTWLFDAYIYDQIDGNFTERRAVGFQTRYTRPGRTAVLLVDYDVAFQQLNSVTLIGNVRVGADWILGFDADHRRSPLLQLSNALIGQSAQDLATLQTDLRLSTMALRQLAIDRTSTSDTVVFSASRAFGERWQFMVDMSGLQLGATPGSGGVAATPSTGLDKSVSMQLSGSSLLQAGDLHILSVRFDDSPISRSTTVSWDARFVVHGAWRLGPRIGVEQLNDAALGGKQTLLLPQIRADWTSRRSVFEMTAAYQLQNQQSVQQGATLSGQSVTTSVDQRSLFLSAAYRVRF